LADIIRERRGPALWLYLNRPERLNAYDYAMAVELRAHIEDSGAARAVVIAGKGRGFCAGGYLADLTDPKPRDIRRLYHTSLSLFETIRNAPQPVIAAVNGPAAGGGNELVVACDLAIAARSASFGQTGPTVGSSPVLGGANFLTMSIGEKRAKEVAFFCRRYKAEEALQLGWINAVVDDERLEEEVQSWVEELARRTSPRYIEMTKVSSNVYWNQTRDAFVSGLGMLAQAIGSHDMIEGASAFVEKRPARFEPLYGGDGEGDPTLDTVDSPTTSSRGASDGGTADHGVGDSPGAVLRPRRRPS
jgi:2-ketocyclohexanecarboxyl-CoA hydrolase